MRAMIDLETLGVKPDAKVLNVGIVLFDEKTILHAYSYSMLEHLDEQQDRSMDANTFRFWLKQPEQAHNFLLYNQGHEEGTLKGKLNHISGVLSRCNEVWGNGAAFDNVILRHLLSTVLGRDEWRYKHDRCFRTWLMLNPSAKRIAPELVHSAVHDALAQTKTLLGYSI